MMWAVRKSVGDIASVCSVVICLLSKSVGDIALVCNAFRWAANKMGRRFSVCNDRNDLGIVQLG